MIGGWSQEEVLNDITALSWALAADLQCFVFFEYVQSSSNIIDKASRATSPLGFDLYRRCGWSPVPATTAPWHLLSPPTPQAGGPMSPETQTRLDGNAKKRRAVT